METPSGNKTTDAARGNQRVADSLTLVCMATTGLLVAWAVLGPQEGMEALGIIIPWGIAVLTHVTLSLPALLLAWKTGRHWRNTWLFLYFLIFWGFHAVYFIQVNEMDAAFMRKVHTVSRPVDADLYQLLARRGARRASDPPLDPAVKVRALALIEQGADIHYRPPGSHYDRGAMILAAARIGDPELVAALLDRGADVDGPGRGPTTPLMAAARWGHSAVAALLIQRGADPESSRYRPNTPLIEAVRNKDIPTVKALLQAGARADYHPPDSVPPLFMAANAGDPEMMALLLDARADPNRMVSHRRSAMLAAVEVGCAPCVKLLLDAGGRPVGTNRQGESVMTIALQKEPEIAALLREAFGTEVKKQAGRVGTFKDLFNAVRKQHWTLLTGLIESGLDPDITGREGQTLLAQIAGRRIWRSPDVRAEVEAATRLIDAGADLNATDSRGRTSLNLAARSGAAELVRLLIDRGADVSAATKDGRSPLLNALWKGYADIAGLLLEAGADPNGRTNWGMNSDSPLKVAVGRGDAAMVRLLLASGADLQSGSTEVCDLFKRAAQQPETVKALAESGVDLNRPDSRGRYPLGVVLYRGHPDSIRALLDAGAHPVMEKWRGYQPIMWFAEKGQVSLLRHTLETYPDLQADHKRLRNVIRWAIRKGQVDVVRELMNYGTFFNRIAEIEALVKWTKPPPEFPQAKAEILALFKERLPPAPPKKKKRTGPIIKLVPPKTKS